jgi:hypothetical protein
MATLDFTPLIHPSIDSKAQPEKAALLGRLLSGQHCNAYSSKL